MAAAGVQPPKAAKMDGKSFLPLLQGKSAKWRDHILYEYYWEWNFPATPTVFAIRGDRYKYIFYHGVWDHDGFYDLQTDPHERHNLINVPAYSEKMAAMGTMRVNITKSWTASCKIFTVLTSESNWPNAEKSFIDTPSIKSTDPSGYPT